MKRLPIDTLGLDLASVFGTLDGTDTTALVSELQGADTELRALRDSLPDREGDPWTFDGVCVDTFPLGEDFITAYVEDSDVCFWLELRPQGHDVWEVDARVIVASSEGGDTAADLPERRCSSPIDACTAFAVMASELSALALSRPPLASAWPTS